MSESTAPLGVGLSGSRLRLNDIGLGTSAGALCEESAPRVVMAATDERAPKRMRSFQLFGCLSRKEATST